MVILFFQTAQYYGDLAVESDWIYTPGGEQKNRYGLHTNGWFTNNQRYGLDKRWGFTKLKGKPFILVFI